MKPRLTHTQRAKARARAEFYDTLSTSSWLSLVSKAYLDALDKAKLWRTRHALATQQRNIMHRKCIELKNELSKLKEKLC